jgi:hypothetical protein
MTTLATTRDTTQLTVFDNAQDDVIDTMARLEELGLAGDIDALEARRFGKTGDGLAFRLPEFFVLGVPIGNPGWFARAH